MNEKLRNRLLTWGCRELADMGHEYVTTESILTDARYCYLFRELLPDQLGISMKMDEEIERLLEELPKN